ncbi:MAG: septum site-determining protein MinC [Pelosinus sp.]|nr:septum site-determining protein MinC [Pelosinus sp.]
MQEDVIFKGSKTGLQLLLSETADFGNIIQQLKEKLESATNFFSKGCIVKVPIANRVLTTEQQQQLTSLFADYGLKWKEVQDPSVSDEQPAAEPTPKPMIITKTLRGGQEIMYSGAVIIMGDVNPGAKVTAGGDIVISGACRGVAHAGAYGDEKATITAKRLIASQLRIADVIARSPDNLDDFIQPDYTETACIKDGAVVIEPAKQQYTFN